MFAQLLTPMMMLAGSKLWTNITTGTSNVALFFFSFIFSFFPLFFSQFSFLHRFFCSSSLPFYFLSFLFSWILHLFSRSLAFTNFFSFFLSHSFLTFYIYLETLCTLETCGSVLLWTQVISFLSLSFLLFFPLFSRYFLVFPSLFLSQ